MHLSPYAGLTAGLLAIVVSAITPQSPFNCGNVVVDRDWSVEGRIPLRFNPCTPITYYNEACPKGTTYMCAMDPAHPIIGRANIGGPTELYRNPKNELVMLYSRGGYDQNGFPFISLVRFECDHNSKETGPMEAVSDGSKYFLIWKTRAACPVSTTASGVNMFLTIMTWIIVIVVLYFVAGVVYNVVIHGKNGTEAIPHHTFLGDLLDFFHELGRNIRARLGSRGGYQQI